MPKPRSAHPESAHPESAHPESAHPESAHPESAQSESAQSESAQSESAQSESAQSESAQSESAQSESAHPESAHPESAHPESAHPESAHPESAHPESAQSESAHPESAHPRASGDRVPHFRQDLPIYLQLLGVALVWGGTFVAGRVVAAEVPPFLAAFGRFAVASVALVAIALRHPHQLRPPPRRLWPWLLLLGLTGVFAYNVLFLVGLQTVPAGRGALIIALNPVVISLAAALLFSDRLSPLKLLGIALSLSGAAIAISNGNPLALVAVGFGRGDLALLGCVASWCAYSLVGKRVMQTLSPLVATTYACGIGAIALGIPAAWELGHTGPLTLSAAAGWGIIYLGVLGSAVGFTVYYNGVRAIGLARASVFINGVPICAILLAALLLREPVTPALAIGAVLVVAGVTCTNR